MHKKEFILIILTIIYVIGVFNFVPGLSLSGVEDALRNCPVFVFGIIFTALVFNFFSSAYRIFLGYRLFGNKISFSNALRVSYSGMLGGLFFLPTLGNMVGQSLALKKTEIPSGIRTAVTLYERFFMLLSGGVAAGFGGAMLFQERLFHTIKLNHNLLQILIVLLIIGGILVWKIMVGREKQYLLRIITKRNLFYGLGVFFLSLFSWINLSIAYGLSIYLLDPSKGLMGLIFGGTLVAFVSSMPISVNGWGIRELAAIKVFQTFGVAPSQALLVGMSMGVLSLISIPMIGLIFRRWLSDRKIKISKKTQEVHLHSQSLERLIIGILGLLTSVFIFFNFNLSFQNSALNINPTDLIAMGGLVILGTHLYLHKLPHEFVILQLKYFIPVTSIALLLSLLVGFYYFGFTSWAFVNKFSGWFVLMGYASLGILFSGFFGNRGIWRLVDVMVLSLTVIISFKLLLFSLVSGKFISEHFLTPNFEGYAQNRNAFACQVLIGICLYHAKLWFTDKGEKFRWEFLCLGLMYYGLVLTFSRTGQIVLALLIPMFFVLRVANLRMLRNIFISVVSVILLKIGVDILFTKGFSLEKLIFANGIFSGENSFTERWYTMKEALRLWMAKPLFGLGLGGFAYLEQTQYARHLVIHNSYIWLLTEFGLLGSVPFFYYGWKVIQYWKTVIEGLYCRGLNPSFNGVMIILTTLAFGLFSLVHDIIYQRIFWFVWGLLVVKMVTVKENLEPSQRDL